MNQRITPRRSTLENRAERLGLVLEVSDDAMRMEAINRGAPMPVWKLSNGKSTLCGYRNLAQVAIALEIEEIILMRSH